MIGTRILAPAVAALLLAAGVALAQPAADEAGAAPSGQQPAKGQVPAAPGKSAPSGDTASGTPAKAGRSPSDYRASEEISEDLPVSFPVDI